MQVVAWSFLIGRATASVIIRETCVAIWEVLSPIYVKTPTIEDWQIKKEEFYEQWNLPNCCGAMDGKHIVIQAPKNLEVLFLIIKKVLALYC